MYKSSYKTGRIIRIIIITALAVTIAVLFQNISDFIKAQKLTEKTGFEPGTAEYADIVVFDVSEDSQSEYSVEKGVAFIQFDNKDTLSIYIDLGMDEDRTYNSNNTPIKNIIENSENLMTDEFNKAPNDQATLKQLGDKYVTAFPLQGVDIEKLPALNLERIKIYDNKGHVYSTHRVDTLYIFHNARYEPLPLDYKLFIEYEGKEYMLYDNEEWLDNFKDLINDE